MRRRSPAWPLGRARPRGWLAWTLAAGLTLAGMAPALADVDYRTEIGVQGIESGPVTQALTAASQLVALQSKPPPSNAALRRRAGDDLPRLIQVMHAEGYWSAKASFQLDESQKPARVTVTIDPGPLYTLASVTFRTPEGRQPTLVQSVGPTAFGLEVGGAARSAPVAAAESQIVDYYARNGYPFARITNRNAVVDVAKHTMSVAYTVDPGRPAKFGAVTIGGLASVDREVVERRIAWKQGTPYDSRLVEATRQDVVRTGLFSAVRIDHADTPDAQGEVAMTVALVEGPPHSIGAGVAYNTTIGFGGQAFWEDRNLFGEGERLRLTAGAAQRQLALALDFRKPDFIDRNQTLIGDAGLLQQTTDAYNSFREQLFAGIERPLLPSLTFIAGPDFEHARVHQNETGLPDEDYSLIGFPMVLRRDTTDDLLDPTIGGRQTLTVTPYHAVSGPTLDFVSSRLELRHYQRLNDTGRLVLAGYTALGSVVGESLDDLPADKRLYAGGAGSVRGYAYQHAGPINAAGVPTGGTSSLELGLELRYRITNTIGIAPFVEGGNVYPSTFPDRPSLFWGAGLGLRYYTLVGPVRLDLATPFTHRPGDSPIQVYISIGQAF